ncbi:MAG TPA: hypothetical protein VJ724_08750, partial [Tahibacter sp.]|nr:hypothetical protein [Tahibacter sp.]
RVLPYWTDDSLVTWLRENDFRLLDRAGLIDREAASSNPYSRDILKIVDSSEPTPWVGLGWRQYLFWFKQVEAAVGGDPTQSARILLAADAKWGKIGESEIYLFDRKNTGDWIRAWLNALRESKT